MSLPDFIDPNDDGVSLRDYFAAQALVAIIGKLELHKQGSVELDGIDTTNQKRLRVMRAVALGAYAYADAMLKARDVEH